MPSDIDPSEQIELEVVVESENGGILAEQRLPISVQRDAYAMQILDAIMDSSVKAGDNLAVDVVLKNRGMEFAQDTFVTVKIPALNVVQKAYLGDLSPVDQADPNYQDAVEGRAVINLPSDAKPGVYNVEIEADTYNGDSTATITKRLMVVGASADSLAVSPATSMTFAAGDSGAYSMTLVNSGSKVQLYYVSIDAPQGLSVKADNSIIAIPAGSSKTVQLTATSEKEGSYDFSVTIQANGDIVKKQDFTAKVEGTKTNNTFGSGSTTVLLTVILAIVFVVLLVVLIVLLTRKPEKSREFGESYY